MRVINERLAGVVARESRKKGLGYEEYRKELKRQVSASCCSRSYSQITRVHSSVHYALRSFF